MSLLLTLTVVLGINQPKATKFEPGAKVVAFWEDGRPEVRTPVIIGDQATRGNKTIDWAELGTVMTAGEEDGGWVWVPDWHGFVNPADLVPVNEARAAITRQIERATSDKDRSKWLWVRGRLYDDARTDEAADRDFSEAIRLDPANAKAHRDRALARLDFKNPEPTFRALEEAERLDPADAVLISNRGYIREGVGDHDGAISDFSRVLRLEPLNYTALTSRASEWRSKGDYEKAIRDNDEAIRLRPDRYTAYHNRALAKMEFGDYPGARDDWDEAIRRQPEAFTGYWGRAKFLASCPDDLFRDGAAAVRDATIACEKTEWKWPAGIDVLAMAHAEAGDFEKAVESERRVIESLSATGPVGDEYRTRLWLFEHRRPYRLPRRPVQAPRPN